MPLTTRALQALAVALSAASVVDGWMVGPSPKLTSTTTATPLTRLAASTLPVTEKASGVAAEGIVRPAGSGRSKPTKDPYNPDFIRPLTFEEAYPKSTKEFIKVKKAKYDILCV